MPALTEIGLSISGYVLRKDENYEYITQESHSHDSKPFPGIK